MNFKFHIQKDKGLVQNDGTKKREDSIEADGLRDTPLNPISSLPTTNCLGVLLRIQLSKTLSDFSLLKHLLQKPSYSDGHFSSWALV